MTFKETPKEVSEDSDKATKEKDSVIDMKDTDARVRHSKMSRIKSSEKEIEKKNNEISDLLNQLKRLQAEFENYKKRVEKERQSFKDYVTADVIKKFLPILDSFELALEDEKATEESNEGLELIYAQLHSLLEGLNVKEIKTVGEKFNPQLHEALLVEESDAPDGVIIEELQKGYTLNNTLLRTAKVKISKSRQTTDLE